ncbi:Phage_integrase domain-containing protein [Vibrio harveyi]|uniref:site-specific integrase n=1 Tax=Vibrio harveyi TaxID=669 RepID=UPI001EFDB10E|nr:site-specific integrase [Vibrio harveyi]MCG9235126.1 site-specific integrase [Vibrio harveyi]MCG9587001.1 site-specific integrase [Vibrio harveyi]CAH1195921.1 Phage_integrase domain-containing protein [Vibrio harveyi]CAH1550781.1 Phage_integrase domain-containing protein [Vibrio harveyi]CAH1583558.1 Phage_integrase domain-containing protein [Vibrio harveyi]
MRYLKVSPSGVWQFRFQLPPQHRHLFQNRREIKVSLRTSSRDAAQLQALELELNIRKTIATSSDIDVYQTQPEVALSYERPKRTPNHLEPLVALDEYYEYKRTHVSEKTALSSYMKCKVALKLLNKPSIQLIRRKDAEQVRKQLSIYPSNTKKHKVFDGLNGTEAINLNQKLGYQVLSEDSVKDYFQKLSSFFKWCVSMEYTDINPFEGFRFTRKKKASEEKQAYSRDNLSLIFQQEIFTKHKFKHPYQFWLPLLARFSGARLNELCQLYVTDIQQIDSVWCIHINDTQEDKRLKNLGSRRFVPIHSALIELGFLTYINSLNTDRVFPELKLERDGYGTAASKWYGRFKSKLGFSKGLDFHSFRHTFANDLKQELTPQLITAQLLGHNNQSVTYDRYGKDLNIKILKESLELVSKDCINFVKINNKF